jgi:hypothetical protein
VIENIGETMSVFWMSILVGCLPRDARVQRGEGLDTAQIEEPSEEPSQPSDEEPTKLPPNAVCSELSDTVSLLNQQLSFDGSNSFDPDGEALSYQWDLKIQPPGSASQIESLTESSTSFQPDLTGQYVSQLVVSNQSGLTDKCKYVFDAIPEQGIWVELYWSLEQDDIALHLLTANAAAADNWFNFLLDEDCHDSNCSDGLEWGDSSSTEDNPHILFDEDNTKGPQVIYIEEPQQEVFRVLVQDRNTETSSTLDTVNTLTIKVYMSGQERLRKVINAPEEGSYLHIADIDVPNNEARALE